MRQIKYSCGQKESSYENYIKYTKILKLIMIYIDDY